MIERVCNIGPALNVTGGISSVLLSYKKLFYLDDKNFISSYNGSFIKSLPLLLKVCAKLLFFKDKFTCYQIHTSSYGSFFRKFLISLILRIRNKKYIVHIHGSEFDKFCDGANFFVKLALKSYFKHAKKIIILSSEMKEILQKLDSSINNFAVIPNPGENIANAPTDLAIHNEPVKILFSGKFGARKGVYDLIKAFSNAKFEVRAKLYLFGDGEVEQVRNVVKKSVKANLIKVSPWLVHDEYIKQISNFDLLVLPSYAERFSMSLVEALGFGLPVISTFVGGTAEVVENNVCGLLVNPGDLNALQYALETLVNNKDLRIKMGRLGWERASSKFTGEIVHALLENVYEEVCK